MAEVTLEVSMNYCRKYFDELETAAKSLDLSEINGKSIAGKRFIQKQKIEKQLWKEKSN